jgi:hypothetical protein
MNSKLFRCALTMCLMVAMMATYSMVALAGDVRTAGEIVVTGNTETSSVTVNGEAVKSGRTIFSSSTISTPEAAGAVLNLGKAGRIELAPKTSFSVTFDDNSISGSLASGSVTVLSATHSVNVINAAGETVSVGAGETASASSAAPAKQTSSNAGTGNWGWYALILGGAIGVIVWSAAKDNENRFGGSATQISPIR